VVFSARFLSAALERRRVAGHLPPVLVHDSLDHTDAVAIRRGAPPPTGQAQLLRTQESKFSAAYIVDRVGHVELRDHALCDASLFAAPEREVRRRIAKHLQNCTSPPRLRGDVGEQGREEELWRQQRRQGAEDDAALAGRWADLQQAVPMLWRAFLRIV
jgi:hypothetical protein